MHDINFIRENPVEFDNFYLEQSHLDYEAIYVLKKQLDYYLG